MTHYTVNHPKAKLINQVLLDGKVVDYVVECDDVAGWVLCFMRRDNEYVVREDGVIRTETFTGKVEVILKGQS